MRSIFAMLLISLLSGGCAVGVQHDYNRMDAQLTIDTKESVAVAVQDRRPYVVSGDKTQDFVGLSRGGFGNPFDVTTLSGKPLANDIGSTIAASLRARKIPVTQVTVGPADDDTKVHAALGATNTGRSVLVTLFEWKADTYMVTQLIYDIRAMIFGPGGKEIARKVLKGREDLGSDAFNPPSHSRKAIPPAFKRKLEELFSDRDVVAAFH